MKKISYILSCILFLLILFYNLNALAQNEALPPKPSFLSMILDLVPLFIMVFLVFYFLAIRPQEKKAREQAELLKSLKKGDQVVTTSGIIGKVHSLNPDFIVIESGSNCRIKVEREHIVKRFQQKKAS